MQTLTINAYNQISNPTAFTYDNAGNQTADAASAYQWYAAGNLEKAFGVTYSYDGDGNRVMKSNGKIYWRDPNGQVLDESDLSGNFTDEYVYFGGMRIAHRVVSSNSIYYYAPDALGTSRVIAGSAGTACYDSDFYPFGGEQNHLNTCGSNYKFNGQERDAESASANDYFGARYNSNILGRFMSPDPGWFFATHPENPQSWNLYSYVLNNPLNAVDPYGYDCVYLNNAGTDVDRDANGEPTGIDQNSSSGECGKNGGYWVDGTVTNVYLSPNSNAVALAGQFDDGTPTKSFYGVGGDSITVNGNGSDPIGTIDASYAGYIQNVGGGGYQVLQGHDPWPTRFFGTHWCGPGGGGVPVNALNAACKAHDACYAAAGISAANNTGGQSMTAGQAAAAQACNQALYNAAKANPFIPGSAEVRTWLKNGDKISILTGGMHADVLAPGTRAQ